jgi:hypothetical protein
VGEKKEETIAHWWRSTLSSASIDRSISFRFLFDFLFGFENEKKRKTVCGSATVCLFKTDSRCTVPRSPKMYQRILVLSWVIGYTRNSDSVLQVAPPNRSFFFDCDSHCRLVIGVCSSRSFWGSFFVGLTMHTDEKIKQKCLVFSSHSVMAVLLLMILGGALSLSLSWFPSLVLVLVGRRPTRTEATAAIFPGSSQHNVWRQRR